MQSSGRTPHWLTQPHGSSTVDRGGVSNVDDYRDARVTRETYYRAEWLNVDMSAAARVMRGTMYVQRFYAESCTRIDLDMLDIADSNMCVLGMIYGAYERSPEHMFGTRTFRESHGFTPLHPADPRWIADAGALNFAWRQAFKSWLQR